MGSPSKGVKRRPYMYTCGVPWNLCGGQSVMTNAALKGSSQNRGHNSPQQAFQCHARWLLSQGYVQHGSRGFSLNDGPIRILTKPSHFGAVLRNGKEGTRNMSSTKHGGNIASY